MHESVSGSCFMKKWRGDANLVARKVAASLRDPFFESACMKAISKILGRIRSLCNGQSD
jgi:hypothetical protein